MVNKRSNPFERKRIEEEQPVQNKVLNDAIEDKNDEEVELQQNVVQQQQNQQPQNTQQYQQPQYFQQQQNQYYNNYQQPQYSQQQVYSEVRYSQPRRLPDNNKVKYTATMDQSLRTDIKIACATRGLMFSQFVEDACREKLAREGGKR